jgi:hypothetical protein
VTFLPGQTGKNIRVRVPSDDDRDEANEAFCMDLFSPMNATLGHSVATVVIRHP